ncbi:MAG: hypothetical protein ACRDID_20845 [Ktedonobacterales bacterium]
MPTIFISYRRADSASETGRLYDRLVERYGRATYPASTPSTILRRRSGWRAGYSRAVAACGQWRM